MFSHVNRTKVYPEDEHSFRVLNSGRRGTLLFLTDVLCKSIFQPIWYCMSRGGPPMVPPLIGRSLEEDLNEPLLR